MTKKEQKLKWAEDREKKIPGHSYRTPVATPLSFPYPLERDFKTGNYVCTWNEKFGGLYLGETKFNKTFNGDKIRNVRRIYSAFVKPHPSGLVYIQQHNRIGKFGSNRITKTIIPGELGLAKTLDILTEDDQKITQVKNIEVDTKIRCYTTVILPGKDLEFSAYKEVAKEKYKASIKPILKTIERQTRKREIAAALLANGVWQKRGFVDKEKIAPKGFWHQIPIEEACKGDRRSIKNWWLDALYREAIKIAPGKKYLNTIKYKDLDEQYNSDDTYYDGSIYRPGKQIEYSRQMRGLREREILLKPLKEALKNGSLPGHPWDTRGWNKPDFQNLKLGYLFQLHTLTEWPNYVKERAPDFDNLRFIVEHVMAQEFLQEISPENKKVLSEFMSLHIDKKPKEAQEILQKFYDDNKNDVNEHNSNKTGASFSSSDTNVRKNFIATRFNLKRPYLPKIFENQSKKENTKYVAPSFLPPEGWTWDSEKKTNLYKSVRNIFRSDIDTQALAICYKKENGIQKEALFRYKAMKTPIKNYEAKQVEGKKMSDLLDSFYGGFDANTQKSFYKEPQKETQNEKFQNIDIVKLEEKERKETNFHLKKIGFNTWIPILYKNCDIQDLRTMKIFERTLAALETGIETKNSDNTIPPHLHPTLKRHVAKTEQEAQVKEILSRAGDHVR